VEGYGAIRSGTQNGLEPARPLVELLSSGQALYMRLADQVRQRVLETVQAHIQRANQKVDITAQCY
jgi:hypothetical protein